MATQNQPFLWFDTNIHSLAGSQTGIQRPNLLHGPVVNGGVGEKCRERLNVESIFQDGMGLSKEPGWKIVQPGQRGEASGWSIQKYQSWFFQDHYCSNSSSQLCQAQD